MTGFIPKEKLTAYQRWEVAAFDEAEEVARNKARAGASQKESATIEAGLAESDQQTIVLPTAADIERMHAEAHEQGYATGYEEGIAEASAIALRLDNLLNSLQQSMKTLDQAVADQLLATAIEIAQQVLRQSLRVKPELVLPVVREAISALHPHPGHPLLFVHPDDASLIRAQLGDQLAHSNWRIIEDGKLTPGGCRVEHGASEVDATLETRWRRVIESMGITQEWLNDKP